jgi:hypothetical protein
LPSTYVESNQISTPKTKYSKHNYCVMSDLAKSLFELLLDSGNEKVGFSDANARNVFFRDYPFSGVEYLTEETISERLFLDIFMPILEEKNESMWFEKRVNLWDFVEPDGKKNQLYAEIQTPSST